MSAGSSAYSIGSEEQRCARRFMVATLSKSLHGGVLNIGPSELNWLETPFICGTDVCRDLREYCTVEMRRLHAVSSNAEHQFVDLSFVVASCSLSEARLNFLCSNFYLDMCRTNFTKGLYEEVRTVHATDDDFDPHFDFLDAANNDAYEYLDEEETLRAIGHIIVAYGSTEDSDASSESAWETATYWRNWAGVRELCATLPPACTFRSIAFYREVSGTAPYAFLLLIEVNRAMRHECLAHRCVENISGGQDTGIYAALYRAVDFEIDVEALQTLVCASRAVQCTGPCLRVDFWRQDVSLGNTAPTAAAAIYGQHDIQDHDWDADMTVLENSKKYSLGLLPKPRPISDNNNNSDDNNKCYSEDELADDNNNLPHRNTDLGGKLACKLWPKLKNNSKKYSWHAMKNALGFVAKEVDDQMRLKNGNKNRDRIQFVDDNNNKRSKESAVRLGNGKDDKQNNNQKHGSEGDYTTRKNRFKNFWRISLMKRRHRDKSTTKAADYGTFTQSNSTPPPAPKRKLGMFLRWTHGRNVAT